MSSVDTWLRVSAACGHQLIFIPNEQVEGAHVVLTQFTRGHYLTSTGFSCNIGGVSSLRVRSVFGVSYAFREPDSAVMAEHKIGFFSLRFGRSNDRTTESRSGLVFHVCHLVICCQQMNPTESDRVCDILASSLVLSQGTEKTANVSRL